MADAKWVKRRVKKLFSSDQENEIRELTAQFYVTLKAYFSRLPRNADNEATYNHVDTLLHEEEQNWARAYEIEQLLVSLYDHETVRAELEIRAMEARIVLRPDQTALYDQELKDVRDADKPAPDPGEPAPALDQAALQARRRVLLARLVNDLQWRYTVNEATRNHSKTITSRAGKLFLTALILFTGLIVYTVIRKPQFAPDDLRLFGFALLSGVWGATFSILASLKDRLKGSGLDDLKVIRPWVMLFSRALIGAGAACIFYFFILSGLLSGSAIQNIFPNFATDIKGVAIDKLPVNQLALLVVWCFLAGFSERLVPSMLDKIEAKAGNSGDTRSDRARPLGTGSALPPPNTQQQSNGT